MKKEITCANEEHAKRIEQLSYELWTIVQEIRNQRQNFYQYDKYDDAVAEQVAETTNILDNCVNLIRKIEAI